MEFYPKVLYLAYLKVLPLWIQDMPSWHKNV